MRGALARLDAEAAQSPLPPVIVSTRPGGRLELPQGVATESLTMDDYSTGRPPWRNGSLGVERMSPSMSPGPTGDTAALRPRSERGAKPVEDGEINLPIGGAQRRLDPAALAKEGKIWGVSLQLYLLRSDELGIGDFHRSGHAYVGDTNQREPDWAPS